MHGSQLGVKAWARLLAMIYDVDPLGGSPCPAGTACAALHNIAVGEG